MFSEDRQRLVEAIIDKHCSELRSRQMAELRQVYSAMAGSGQWKSRLNHKHAEHMRELGTYIAKTYLEAYEKEGKVLDNNNIPVMMAKITYRLNAETNDRALKLSEFSGLSTEMESLLSHVKSILEQDLYIKMKSAELDRKTDQLPTHNRIEDQIAKETRVLLRLYRMTEGRTFKGIEYDDVALAEGLDSKEVFQIFDRLHGPGLVKDMSFKLACITEEGVKKIRDEVFGQKDNVLVEAKMERKQTDLSFVTDQGLRAIVERDYEELQMLDPGQTSKAALVLAGGVIEGILLDALVLTGDPRWTLAEGCKRFLKDMIGAAVNKGIIKEDKFTHAIRNYRNVIHPGKEIQEKIVFGEADARVAHAGVDVVIREVREWHSKQSNSAA
jgi:hypothetical protein